MDSYTLGDSRGAVKLITILEEVHPNGGSRQRKILRSFNDYNTAIKGILHGCIDVSLKKHLLQLVYEEKKRYFQNTSDCAAIKTHALNVCQLKYVDALREIERSEKYNKEKFSILVKLLKGALNVR